MKFWNVIITSKEWKFREHAKTNGHTETAFFFKMQHVNVCFTYDSSRIIPN